MTHFDRSSVEIGSREQIVVRRVLNFDVVEVALGIGCQYVKAHRMTECVFDTVLSLDFDDVQVVFLDDGANDVLRRRFIAKKHARNDIGKDRHLIVCLAQFFLRETGIKAFSGSIRHHQTSSHPI